MKHKVLLFVCLMGMAVCVAAMWAPDLLSWTETSSVQQVRKEKRKAKQQPQKSTEVKIQQVEKVPPAQMLPEYQKLYEKNQDIVGWLKIEDTIIDYPVMQTKENEEYYLEYDFYGNKNVNGSLILDADSDAGTGTAKKEYRDGTHPTTNLIIHGHTMKSGQMFGNLQRYRDEVYGKKHHIIQFDSLYEHRTYELIAVFYSQVYYKNDQVFKYYNFFQADTKEEFQDWYRNIKKAALYDTQVTAEFGDEFITLSCCSYHVDDGRFVVVGKRIS